MQLKLIDIVNIILSFQLLVFIFFLLRRKSHRLTGYWEQPNRLLSFFLLIQVFLVINFECFHLQEYMIHFTPHVFFIGTPFFLLAAPVFYFYVRSLVFSDFRFRITDILHALPFLTVLMIFAYRFYFLPSAIKINLVAEGKVFSHAFWIVYEIIFFIQFAVYFFMDLRILRYYREQIKQQYSSVSHINLSWLTVVLYGFIVAWLSSVAGLIFRSYLSVTSDLIPFIDFMVFFCFFNYIFYKGLSQPEIFSGIVEKPKYEASRLTPAEGRSYMAKLEQHMLGQKPHLNPMLTLKDLASQISVPPRYLSQIINEYTHQNFYDFVNRYRIEETKRLLADASADMNIAEILYEVGFNSKSSFNTAFKEATGVSPSQFKKRNSTDRSRR